MQTTQQSVIPKRSDGPQPLDPKGIAYEGPQAKSLA